MHRPTTLNTAILPIPNLIMEVFHRSETRHIFDPGLGQFSEARIYLIETP
jgi:hypothetical protein